MKSFVCRRAVVMGWVGLALAVGVQAGPAGIVQAAPAASPSSAKAARPAAMVLYVAPNGNDGWSGQLREPNANRTDGPLATPQAARDAVRRLHTAAAKANRPFAPVTVRLAGGTYRLAEPFVLEPQDSGTPAAPVVYEAEGGQTPILSGGQAITGWHAGKGGIWTAQVPGVAEGKWSFRQLFVNGHRRDPARMPNKGYFYVAGKAPLVRNVATGKLEPSRTAFVYAPGDIRPWGDLGDACVVVFHSWETSRLRIAHLDEAKHIVTFTGPARWPFERWGPHQRYYVENIREALDAPGEWYLDRRTGTLSYIPIAGEDLAKAEIVAPRLRHLVEFRGDPARGRWIRNVTLRGLTFRYESWKLEPQGHSDPQAAVTVSAALLLDGARDCSIERCEISHVGEYGLWLRRGCKDCRVVHCRLCDLGAGGVRVGEATMPAKDACESSGNLIDNNLIYDGGHVYAAGVGVWVAQSGHNTISHNDIHDLTYSGMSIGWNWNDAPNRCNHNLIEYNHVHHVMNGVLSDGGAIYALGVSTGSVIRGNLLHDVWPYPHPPFGWGIYLDASTSGYLVEDNVVYHTLTGGLMYHNGGHANVIRNNVFALSANYQLWPYWSKPPETDTFTHNIVYWTQGKLFVPFAEGILRTRLRAKQTLGTWDDNVYWHAGKGGVGPGSKVRFFHMTFAQWKALGVDAHSVIADPRFVNAGKMDFRLRSDSPARKLGIHSIDVSKAGLYGEPAWVAEARSGHPSSP